MLKPPPLASLRCFVVLIPLLFSGAILSAETTEGSSGKFYGAKMTEFPDWFKESFLNFPDDIAEAKAAGKRVVVFFHQEGCPYCNALVERNLAQKDIAEKVKKNFDVIGINMWGDREVTYVNGKHYIEKTLAEALKVQFTPTLLFYDENGKIVLRLNGYRSPSKFTVDLDYVALRKENETKYLDYIKAKLPLESSSSGGMHKQDFFVKEPYNLKIAPGNKTPIAVFFEQPDCPDCDTLHEKVLPDQDLRKIIGNFKTVQLDMWSKTPVVTPQGEKTTAREWAGKLDIKFAPSIVVFNEKGEEIIRTEGSFKVFHTQGILDYVLSGKYKNQPSFQRYLSDRANSIREQGKDVDIWNYADEKPGDRI